MNNFSGIFDLSTGYELEDELVDSFSYYFKKKGLLTKEIFRRSNKDEDVTLGTDAFVYGLPIDFTCNFSGKNHTEVLNTAISLSGIGSIRFGIRTGNGRTKFEKPVLIIGIDTDQYLRKNQIVHVVDAVSSKIERIIEVGSDAYWGYCDEFGIEF